MAFTYSTATKTARMNATLAQIDAGTGPGKLEIGTAGMATVLASITLNDPAGSVSGAVLSLAGFPKTVTALAAGTAAAARLVDSANTAVITGLTVGTASADVVLDSVTVNSGQQVTINATPSITHAA